MLLFPSIAENTCETICTANCSSLKSSLLHELTLSKNDLKAFFQSEKDKFPCPSHGIITYKLYGNGSISVSCSTHAGISYDLAPALENAITSIPLNTNNRVDSNAVNGEKAKKIKETLINAGVNLDTIGIKTWAVVNSEAAGVEIIWTDKDISSGSVSKVPVICYNQNKKSYTVGYSNIQAWNNYYVIANKAQINGYGIDPSNQESEPFTSFDDVVTAYKALK